MKAKAKLFLIDNKGEPTGDKLKLFVLGRPTLLRWVIKNKEGQENQSYFRRIDLDEYMELTPDEVKHLLDHLKLHEIDPEELTIDSVLSILSLKIQLS